MLTKGALLALVVLLSLGNAGAVRGASMTRPPSPPPVVIAIVESGGLNVLHSDFRARKALDKRGIPAGEIIPLPTTGTYEERVAAARRGPLGDLEPGSFYRLPKSKVVGVYVPADSQVTDLLDDTSHATGTASSAVGKEHGTNPDAALVYVVDSGPAAWRWVAQQSWIDIVSTSYFGASNDGTCVEGPYIEDIVSQGRMVFSSSGNAEQIGAVSSPSGVPATYQVGGVDSSGNTYLPDPSDPSAFSTPTRPYETGDRFDFRVAAGDSLHGSRRFVGTSGATPSTAGRAARLIQTARTILGSRWTGARGGVLARTDGGRLPLSGPLADGEFTADELTDLLHHTARPSGPSSPMRYHAEGYGAHDERTIEFAAKVLKGIAREPSRSEDDASHARTEETRASVMSSHCDG